jgi:hypothetical protein
VINDPYLTGTAEGHQRLALLLKPIMWRNSKVIMLAAVFYEQEESICIKSVGMQEVTVQPACLQQCLANLHVQTMGTCVASALPPACRLRPQVT